MQFDYWSVTGSEQGFVSGDHLAWNQALPSPAVTLLVALRGMDGLVLAADSRGTFGDPRGVTAQNDSQQKAHVLAPHVAALQAGAGELGTNVVGRTREVLGGKISIVQQTSMGFPGQVSQPPILQTGVLVSSIVSDGVTPVMGALRDVSRASYHEWFPSVPPVPAPGPASQGQVATRPDLQFVVAGYEMDGESVGEPRIYSLGSGLDFAPSLHDYGFAVAGIPTYALYLLNRLYEQDRSVSELTALAVYVITETASQDGKVGGPVSVIQVTPGEGCKEMDAGQVDVVVSDNQNRSAALRDSFYEHGDGDV
jgi:20S proteasome alpha/beta subunit